MFKRVMGRCWGSSAERRSSRDDRSNENSRNRNSRRTPSPSDRRPPDPCPADATNSASPSITTTTTPPNLIRAATMGNLRNRPFGNSMFDNSMFGNNMFDSTLGNNMFDNPRNIFSTTTTTTTRTSMVIAEIPKFKGANKSYYEILNISEDADAKSIKKAYKELALKWHPDKNKDDKVTSTEKFKEIAEAYSVLSDPEKRKEYNSSRENFEFKHDGEGDFDFKTAQDIHKNFYTDDINKDIFGSSLQDEMNKFFPDYANFGSFGLFGGHPLLRSHTMPSLGLSHFGHNRDLLGNHLINKDGKKVILLHTIEDTGRRCGTSFSKNVRTEGRDGHSRTKVTTIIKKGDGKVETKVELIVT